MQNFITRAAIFLVGEAVLVTLILAASYFLRYLYFFILGEPISFFAPMTRGMAELVVVAVASTMTMGPVILSDFLE